MTIPSKLENLTTSPARGILMAAAALVLLLQGIYYSQIPGLFIPLFAITLFLFFLFPFKREELLLWIVPLGPIFNATFLYRDNYLYNMEVVLLTYFSLWYLFNLRKIDIAPSNQAFSWYRIFFIIVFLTTLIRIYLHNNLNGEIRLIRAYFIGYFMLLFLNNPSPKLKLMVKKFFQALTISLGFVSLFGILAYSYRILTTGSWHGEPASVFSSSETLAIFLVLSLPAVLGGTELLPKKWWRHGAYFAVTIGFVLLLATRSRAGLLGTLIIAVLYFVYRFKYMRPITRRFSTIALIVVLLAASGIVLLKSLRWGNVGHLTFTRILQQTSFSRLEEWQQAIQYIHQSPLWGNGPVSNFYNLYLQISAQFGLLALLMFGLFLFYVLQPFFARRHQLTSRSHLLGLSLGTISFLITSLAESTIGNQIGYFVWFYLLFQSISLNFSKQ